jgi:hypothetical protein
MRNKTFLPLNDIDLVEAKKRRCCLRNYRTNSRCGGLDQGTTEFFQALEKICKAHEVLILDEVQSGFGRRKVLHTNFIILSQISFAWLKEWGTDLLEAS